MFLPSPRRLAAIAAVVTALSIPLFSQAGPRITVDRAHQFEPGKVEFRIDLPREHDDVMMCYGYVRYYTHRYRDGSVEPRDEGRRSCQALHGEHDLRFHYIPYRNLPWGEYVAYLHIYSRGQDLDHPRLVSSQGFLILRSGEE